jgi:Ca-activated chloride channel family protein
VDVYAIGLFDTGFFKSFEELMGKTWLNEITDATGGRTIKIDSSTKIPETAATISRLLRNQYVLGYRPNNARPDGKRRRIKVQTINASSERTQLQAHYKTGYVVPKED